AADAGGADAAPADAPPSDAAPPADAAPQADSAPPADAAPADAPPPGTGDLWLQIDYGSAYTAQSPAWSFSPTPGWGAAQWATSGSTWPEVWDRWNNITISNDPIGRAAIIGPSGSLQLMLGLEELISYQSATVHLEGRSYATSSWVTFDAWNPLNGCGGSGQMDQDWTMDLVDVDLGTCLIAGAGGGIEAVRLEPTGGSDAIALVRLRVTLHNARW
ncbi:MAG TPA: hypothetical protein VGQ83_05220, partial [Polyangia bacterium]